MKRTHFLFSVISFILATFGRLEPARAIPEGLFPPEGFFTPDELSTIAAASEALHGGSQQMMISPAKVAANIDELLDKVPKDVSEDFKVMIHALEHWLPLLVFSFGPFSKMSLRGRRAVIRKCVAFTGGWLPLNDIARGIKTITCAGYYGDETVMRSIGYVPFEERPRSIGADTTPAIYRDPFSVNS